MNLTGPVLCVCVFVCVFCILYSVNLLGLEWVLNWARLSLDMSD